MTGWAQTHRWVIVVVLVALVAVGLGVYRFHHQDAVAEAKAEQLTAELRRAGLPAPSTDTIARVLGDDGGPVCRDPGDALNKALLDAQLVNGAAFVGQRPILGDPDMILGESLVLQVYCPGQLTAFHDAVRGYHLDDVSGG